MIQSFRPWVIRVSCCNLFLKGQPHDAVGGNASTICQFTGPRSSGCDWILAQATLDSKNISMNPVEQSSHKYVVIMRSRT